MPTISPTFPVLSNHQNLDGTLWPWLSNSYSLGGGLWLLLKPTL